MGIATKNLNEDGKQDLVLTTEFSDEVVELLCKGNGNFLAAMNTALVLLLIQSLQMILMVMVGTT